MRLPFAIVIAGLTGSAACQSSTQIESRSDVAAAASPASWRGSVEAPHVSVAAVLVPQPVGELSRCILLVTVRFERDWHGYAQVPAQGGLRETVIGLRLPEGVELLGPWKRPEGQVVEDDDQTRTYEGVALFSRELALTARLAGALEVNVDYQVCDESVCLPPTSVSVVLDLGSEAIPITPEVASARADALVSEYEASRLRYGGFRPRFEAFEVEHRGMEAEVTARLWLIRGARSLRSDGEMESTADPLVDDLLERHAESPQLAELPEISYVFSREKRVEVYERLAMSPHAQVRAPALLLEALFQLRSSEPEAAARMRAICERLLDEYADLPFHETTYGAMAHACLFRHPQDHLVVGKVAPDIQGEDGDGTAFALSDYRGKVVLLDFWGDW